MVDETAVPAEARVPKQGRSRASFERMIETATELLQERAGADFTLTEVSKRGKVSIGSIYCRFDSKDALIREAHARVMARYSVEEEQMLDRVRRKGDDLGVIVPVLVNELAEFLKKRAPVMAPFMVCATHDPQIARVGKEAHAHVVRLVRELLLEYRAEITHPDPEHAVDAMFQIVYATLARYLGLGTSPIAMAQGDWTRLKEDLGAMSLAFLQLKPAAKKKSR